MANFFPFFRTTKPVVRNENMLYAPIAEKIGSIVVHLQNGGKHDTIYI